MKKELFNFIDKAEAKAKFLEAKVVLGALILFLLASSCSPPPLKDSNMLILSSVKDQCDSGSPACQLILSPYYTDLYKYHYWVILFSVNGESLEAHGYKVVPSNEPCPEGAVLLPAGEIEGVRMVLMDDGSVLGKLDYSDTPVDHFCASPLR